MAEQAEEKNVETYTALKTWAGSCNLCTLNDYERVLVVRSSNESRNLNIRLCPTCQRELLEALKEAMGRCENY